MIPYIMVEPKQWSEMIQAMEENARLKAEVERLRKTGDAMLWFISKKTNASVYADIAKEWNAAKEGKPSV